MLKNTHKVFKNVVNKIKRNNCGKNLLDSSMISILMKRKERMKKNAKTNKDSLVKGKNKTYEESKSLDDSTFSIENYFPSQKSISKSNENNEVYEINDSTQMKNDLS